jgi:hypothetical protein
MAGGLNRRIGKTRSSGGVDAVKGLKGIRLSTVSQFSDGTNAFLMALTSLWVLRGLSFAAFLEKMPRKKCGFMRKFCDSLYRFFTD